MKSENTPQYDEKKHIIFLPEVEGVTWTVNDKKAAGGRSITLKEGETAHVQAYVEEGYIIDGDDRWSFEY